MGYKLTTKDSHSRKQVHKRAACIEHRTRLYGLYLNKLNDPKYSVSPITQFSSGVG